MNQLIAETTPIIVNALTILIPALAAYIVFIIRKKIGLENNKIVLETIDNVVKPIVMDLSQTVVKDLKKAAKDNKVDNQELKDIKEQAIKKVKKQMNKQLTKQANKAVNCLNTYISNKIEETIFKSKRK